jgi:hypothetical protein
LTITVAAATPDAYTIEATSTTGNTFLVANDAGTMTYECTVDNADNRGGCPGEGEANGTWDG